MNIRRWYPVSRLAPEQIKASKHSVDPSTTVPLPGVQTATDQAIAWHHIARRGSSIPGRTRRADRLNRQAAAAVRGRIDWKYALGLELTDSGFDHTVLSEFRSHLVQNQAERLLLDLLLKWLRERGLIKVRGRQRTDSTYVLAAVRSLNRLERVGETLARP